MVIKRRDGRECVQLLRGRQHPVNETNRCVRMESAVVLARTFQVNEDFQTLTGRLCDPYLLDSRAARRGYQRRTRTGGGQRPRQWSVLRIRSCASK